MRCPQCKREVAFSAMSCVCGWSAVVSRAVEQAAGPVKPVEPQPLVRYLMPREVREQVAAILAKGRRYREHPHERLPQSAALLVREVTEGHGNCTCEICFAKRMGRPVAQREDRDASGE